MIISYFDEQQTDALRRLNREADVWARLKHPNLVPFYGIANDRDIAPWPVLVSPFYEHGHVGQYLGKHPEANRQYIVLGVAAGLVYLHANDVVHGDLKVVRTSSVTSGDSRHLIAMVQQNVLVDKRRIPRICDFGISKLINRRGFTTTSVGTPQYMAPELLIAVDSDQTQAQDGVFPSPSTTKSSDVYSFALLVLEILTSAAPKGRPTRPFMAAKGLPELRPKRADYHDHELVTDEIWSILDRCWVFEPHARPRISDVLVQLSSAFQL
ncbi:kinase-like domain-containing protein [Mycena galericulata]|nr:kinase-like domain-containing protein [Mycena galericulata]